jgi:hypothetical protein
LSISFLSISGLAQVCKYTRAENSGWRAEPLVLFKDSAQQASFACSAPCAKTIDRIYAS